VCVNIVFMAGSRNLKLGMGQHEAKEGRGAIEIGVCVPNVYFIQSTCASKTHVSLPDGTVALNQHFFWKRGTIEEGKERNRGQLLPCLSSGPLMVVLQYLCTCIDGRS